jgi:acetyltransferase-like isoleucine patch superfamily enzyme
MIEGIAHRVKCRDDFLSRAAKALYRGLSRASVPCIKPLHLVLYYERVLRRSLWHRFMEAFYYVPVFEARCASVGRGLRLECGIPQVMGNLEIHIGDDVTINGVNTFSTNNMRSRPVMKIGSGCYIGHQVSISVASSVIIGNHCLIADRVMISDNDGHPLDPVARRMGLPVPDEDVAPVVLEDDVWVGSRAVILKGVKVGTGSVVGAGAVVTRDVPPFVVVAGNPARVVKQLEFGGEAVSAAAQRKEEGQCG